MNAEDGCWADGCDGLPEWRVEPLDGDGVTNVYLSCGDADDVFQAIATFVAHGTPMVVVSAWQPPAIPEGEQ